MTTETETTTETKPKLDDGTGTGDGLMRHIVELDAEGKPTDQCLCGHLWDRVFLKHGTEICQKCVDELKRRGHG